MKYAVLALMLTALPAAAGPPKIENVQVVRHGATWRFDVAISHPDTGWDHYADAWRILDMSGKQLALRELTHPHVNEQPVTRSLSSVTLPAGTEKVQIQARDLPGGWNPDTVTVDLPR